MTSQTIIGIDPGAHGAIAVMNEGGDLLEVLDMSSTPEANGRTATNAPLPAGVRARVAFCEFVGHVRPTRRLPRLLSGEPAVSSRGAPALLASRSCSSRRRHGSGSPTSHPAPTTRTWPVPVLSPAGRPAPISSAANATSTALRRASSVSLASCGRRAVADDLEIAIAAGAVTALRRRAARQTELVLLGTIGPDKTPGVLIRTGEAALADRLANAWAALAQELENPP